MNPTVFISYSHEEPEHDNWVHDLAANLRKKGVDASLDRWDLRPGQDTTFFMESQIRNSEFVVLVCTPLYAEKSNIPRGGVGYEKNIISAEMLQSKGLEPKFIPILRKGNHDNALPTYLGSKYAIDFRPSRTYEEAFDELLRAIYGEPHPDKPLLGEKPIFKPPVSKKSLRKIVKKKGVSNLKASLIVEKPCSFDIDVWEKEAEGRFNFLRTDRLSTSKKNPFQLGYWQASFVLCKEIYGVGLKEFLEILRASETGRTGWDIGWVPTRSDIAPYPYKGGIEVWLAEDGGKEPGHSDFWRAEPSGKFSLFRGYQEDGGQMSGIEPGKILDFYLMLWRISEFLLYIESFSEKIGAIDSPAIIKITWKGLQNRKIGTHKHDIPFFDSYICHQQEISSPYKIESCRDIKKNLVHDVYLITKPLFEIFDFFSINEGSIKSNIRKLFDTDKEG